MKFVLNSHSYATRCAVGNCLDRSDDKALYGKTLNCCPIFLYIILQVLLGDADYFNATLYGIYLVVSYGSQLVLAYAALQGTLGFTGAPLLGTTGGFSSSRNDGSSSSSGSNSNDYDDLSSNAAGEDREVGASRVVLAVMCCAEALLAVGLAVSVRCGLGTTLWSRVRVSTC